MSQLTDKQILIDIGQLRSDLSGRRAKYIRNYNQYLNNGYRRDQIDNIYNPPQAFWYMSAEADTGPIPVMNVLRSVIQTLCSKLSQTKVRPFFNPINGTWKTRRVARGALQFFDLYFDSQELFTKGIECRRDASILDMGVMKIDDDRGDLQRIQPWRFFFDRAEYHYGGEKGLTRCYDESHHFPTRLLLQQNKENEIDWLKTFKSEFEREPIKKCEYTQYYDLIGKTKHYFVDGKKVGEKRLESEISPYVLLFQERPIKGAYSSSIIDDAYTLQTMINMVLERIEVAVELTPANIVLIPIDSEIKKSMWSNQVSAIYEYHPTPLVPAGPQIATPSPISPEYLEIAKWFEEKIYNLTGVSQFSAESKKPEDLASGVALQTVQDVESNRFQVALDDQVSFYMRITQRVIDTFPNSLPLFEEQLGRARITWQQVRKERANFSIQFAAASALSKDPSIKMAEIEKLISMGVIPEDMAAEYLEFPDLEKLEGKLSAVNDVIEYIIEKAAEDGDFDYDSVIPGALLEQKVLTELFHVLASGDDGEAVDNLRDFYRVVRENNNALMTAENMPPSGSSSAHQSPTIAPSVTMPQQTNQAAGIGPQPIETNGSSMQIVGGQ